MSEPEGVSLSPKGLILAVLHCEHKSKEEQTEEIYRFFLTMFPMAMKALRKIRDGKQLNKTDRSTLSFLKDLGFVKTIDKAKELTIPQMRKQAKVRVDDYIRSIDEDPTVYKKTNPKRYNELYNEFGVEDYGSAKWQLTTGKKPVRVTVINDRQWPVGNQEKIIDVWDEEDQTEILDAQKLMKHKDPKKRMSKDAYHKFLIELLEVDFGD